MGGRSCRRRAPPAQQLGQRVVGRARERDLGGAGRLDVAGELGEVGAERKRQRLRAASCRPGAAARSPRRDQDRAARAHHPPCVGARASAGQSSDLVLGARRPANRCTSEAASPVDPTEGRHRIQDRPVRPQRNAGRAQRRAPRCGASASGSIRRSGAPPAAPSRATRAATPRRRRARETRSRGIAKRASRQSASAARSSPSLAHSGRRRRCAARPARTAATPRPA